MLPLSIYFRLNGLENFATSLLYSPAISYHHLVRLCSMKFIARTADRSKKENMTLLLKSIQKNLPVSKPKKNTLERP